MSATPQNRQPVGVPTGGQFAATARPESAVGLAPVKTVRMRDDVVMDRIALALGAVDEWSTADDLDQITGLLAASGRPHPGATTDPEAYRALFAEYRSGRTGPVDATARALDNMALELGGTPSWSPEDLESVADLVATAGLPHPGDGSPDEYIVQVAIVRAARATSYEDAQSRLADGIQHYLDRQFDVGELGVDPAGFTVYVEEGDDGTPHYGSTIDVRGWGDMDEDIDLAGTPAEELLVELARNAPKRGRLDPVVR